MDRMFDLKHVIGMIYNYAGVDYKMVREVSSGGVGTVILANNLDSDINICIKFLNPRKQFENHYENIKERFYHEATMGMNFKHENILPIFDVGKLFDHDFYSMEYCKFGDLKGFIRSKNYFIYNQLNYKLTIFIQLCSALNYLHQTGVHRDLKPDNILVYEYSYDNILVKLSDFGTFYDLKNEEKNPETNIADRFGSLLYISPEQRQGNRVGIQSDIYSLGVIFYQILMEDVDEIRFKRINVKELDSEQNFILESLISRMCESDPEFRYKNVNEIMLDIRDKLLNKYKESYLFKGIAMPSWVSETIINPNTSYLSSNSYHKINISNLSYKEKLWEFSSYDFRDVGEEDIKLIATETVVNNNVVLAGWNNGKLTSLSLTSGKVNWAVNLSTIAIESTPAIKGNKCFIVDVEGNLFCCNLYDGTLIWKINIDKQCTCPLKIIDNKLFVVTNNKAIVNVSIDDGSVVDIYEWNYYGEREKEIKIIRIIDSESGLFYLCENNIIGFPDIVNEPSKYWLELMPNVTWQEGIGYGGVYNGMVFDNKNLYATCSNGAILCINSITGSIIWKIETCEDPSIPFMFGEYLCFLTNNGSIYMCDKKTGSTQKKMKVSSKRYYKNEELYYGIPIVTNNNLLIFESTYIEICDINYFVFNSTEINVGDYYYDYEADYLYSMALPTFCSNKMLVSSPNGIDAFMFI